MKGPTRGKAQGPLTVLIAFTLRRGVFVLVISNINIGFQKEYKYNINMNIKFTQQ